MEDDQQFCLRWNNHQSTLISVFDTLLENQTLVDCTLAAEGQFLKAHKVVLSACSPFFATLLQQQYDKHPIFILKDVKYQELRAMMDYMYRGEVNISQDQLAALLKAAESLQIKGLSDNRSGSTPKTEQHRGLNVPGSSSGSKLSGYTLEQTQSKRSRIAPSTMETADISGSREGSSSPSRRRRKGRRRSIENTMSADVHDNSNSSQMNQPPLQPQQQLSQSNASLAGVVGISAATSSLPVSATSLSAASSGVLAATGSIVGTQGTHQMTTNITKKTESVKVASDIINSENMPVAGVAGTGDDHSAENVKGEKSNHKQKSSTAGVATKETAEMVIEPKSEYEDEGNEGTVEDLTLDDEEMAMEDLDQNAGTSQAGEGSSQGYAPWQHDRSQDDILMAPQEAQQRDPQDEAVKAVSDTSTIVARVSSNHRTAGSNVYNSETQSQSQSESRIRVRDWLMLADQSILQKAIDQQPDKSLITNTNATTNTITSAAGLAIEDDSARVPSAVSAALVPLGTTTAASTSATSTTNQPTLMRIGSIGRTTITCVAPRVASNDGEINLLNNGNMGVISAAALAAAGVELESVDESMTEVLVKIENSSSSTQDDDEEMMEAEGDENGEGDFIGDEEQQVGDSRKEQDFNYELKLSSPMSWAFDTVKIENEEEFEDILSGENDTTNTEDEDDLLTTAAATTKQAAVNSSDQQPTVSLNVSTKEPTESLALHNPSSNSSDGALLKCKQRGVGKKRTQAESRQETSLPSKQQQLLLLEQQQHLQHLQLRPTQQTLQFKLASIPATITSFTTTTTTTAAAAAATTTSNNDNSGTNDDNVIVGTGVGVESNTKQDSSVANTNKNTDFKSSVSDDKRYRILVQNQRMRKESLEHSEDMIYNADIEKPWVCRNCNRNYKWKNSLKCHLKNECGQPPRYFCSKLCGYATNVHSNLKRHLNTKCRDRMEEDQKTNTSTYTLVFQQNE